MGKYISPFTDFGFKKLFGEKASIPILIDFFKLYYSQLYYKNPPF